MDVLIVAEIFGYIGAGLGIVMFMPQAWRVHKTRNTKSISLLSFILVAISCIFWLGYGFILMAMPVIIVNCVLFVLSAYIISMKLKHG